MTDATEKRRENFAQKITESDERALEKSIDFEQHRFVSIERDVLTSSHFAKGHKSLRGACGHLARTVEGGEAYVPEFVLDLDTGEMHEIDLFVHVAPRSIDGVAVLLSRSHWEDALVGLRGRDEKAHLLAIKAIESAIERRR